MCLSALTIVKHILRLLEVLILVMLDVPLGCVM